MQLLIPAPSSPEVDLHQFYGQDWLEPGGVRANFIASVDGSATVAGLSRGLQTGGDNRIFAALRDLADVILVGASTAASEGYQPISLSPERQFLRRSLGLTAMPATAVVSGSLHVDLASDLYTQARPEAPTIIITGPHAPMSIRNDIIDLAGSAAALQLAEVAAGPGGVSLAGAVARLNEFGYRRILCEGGPRLFGAALADGSVTELCLSVSPVLAGSSGPRILNSDSWPDGFVRSLTLKSLLSEDQALFCRYLIGTRPA
jgi:riboflavin biosynthesis pyrimidine reductase